jgi:hypothetical protein
MKPRNIITLAIVLCLLLTVQVMAQREERVEKTYDGKSEIRIKLILGDCDLLSSRDDRIHVSMTYTYDKSEFEPRFREKGSTVYVEEKFHGNDPQGRSHWTIRVPEDVEVDFNSATGDMTIEGVFDEIEGSTGTGYYDIQNAKGEFDLSTGTGNIDLTGCEGQFELSSGTGNIRIKDCTGDFDVSSGTGDVDARNITIEMDAEFSSGTGDAEVSGPKGDDFYLSVSSGTDDAVLDMAGRPLQGTYEMRCHARKGRISSPVKFDTENVYDRGDNDYLEKIFTRGKDTPRYEISTGTGTARLVR